MKRFFVSAFIAALTYSSFASNAAAMSEPARSTLLTVRASAGLVPEGLILQEIGLRTDGSVFVNETFRNRNESGDGYVDTHQSRESLWFETPETMQKIFAATLLIKGGELADQDPKKPRYADGLFLSYELSSGEQKTVFARSSGGHDFLPADRAQHAAVRYLLADLNALRSAILSENEK